MKLKKTQPLDLLSIESGQTALSDLERAGFDPDDWRFIDEHENLSQKEIEDILSFDFSGAFPDMGWPNSIKTKH